MNANVAMSAQMKYSSTPWCPFFKHHMGDYITTCMG